jgi:hypothetical protein
MQEKEQHNKATYQVTLVEEEDEVFMLQMLADVLF